MAVVRRKQRAPLAERVAFATHPERELEAEIGEAALASADGDDEPRSRFVETQAYSERVVELGEWVPPDLPFLKGVATNWLPERFSVVLGGALVTLQPDDVPDALTAVRTALGRGEATAMFEGVEVPATSDVERTLARLDAVVRPPDDDGEVIEPDVDDPGGPEPATPTTLVLRTHTNHHERDFDRGWRPRPGTDAPPSLRSTLRPHQEEALAWLRAAHRLGRPGVLLADDMGLGKTVEVLAFLSALREGGEEGPFLIVAPTSLLDNWTAEHHCHLARGLGQQVTAYGGGAARAARGAGARARARPGAARGRGARGGGLRAHHLRDDPRLPVLLRPRAVRRGRLRRDAEGEEPPLADDGRGQVDPPRTSPSP